MTGRNILSLAVVFSLLTAVLVGAGASAGPIGVSQNGRYFVAANGDPFYFDHGRPLADYDSPAVRW